ncbi:MAG: hypothetical protein JSR73_14110 [Proteobacteria bacterium]|nr:hypothetical protein [Pseudomonadota bacterium]
MTEAKHGDPEDGGDGGSPYEAPHRSTWGTRFLRRERAEKRPEPDRVISEEEALQTAERHLNGLTKLLAIPVPLIAATMVALGTNHEQIELFAGRYPREYADAAARTIITLVFAQCSLHLALLCTMTELAPNSEKLRRLLAWHPGPCNPFYVTPMKLLRNRTELSNMLDRLAIWRLLTTQMGVGFVVGFAQGFRMAYAPMLVAYWYSLAGYGVYYFNRNLSDQLITRALTFERAPAGGHFDNVLAIVLFGVTISMAMSIIGITEFVRAREGKIRWPLLQLLASYLFGYALAIRLSASIQ